MLFETTYNYAGFEINAAQDDDGNYWISFGTIDKIIQSRMRRLLGSERLEAALPNGYTIAVCSEKTDKSPRKKQFVSLPSFLAIMAALAKPTKLATRVIPSNENALAFVIAGFTSDFVTSLKTHFGETFSEEEREYLRTLVFARIQAFKAWTDVIHNRYIKFYDEKPPKWLYGKLIKKANLKIFGVPNFNSDRTNYMTEDQQETIKDFERLLVRKAKLNPNMEPTALLEVTLEAFTT